MSGTPPTLGAVLARLAGHGARVPWPVSGIGAAPHAFGFAEAPSSRQRLR